MMLLVLFHLNFLCYQWDMSFPNEHFPVFQWATRLLFWHCKHDSGEFICLIFGDGGSMGRVNTLEHNGIRAVVIKLRLSFSNGHFAASPFLMLSSTLGCN